MTLAYGAIVYNQFQETSSRLNEQLEQQSSLLAVAHAAALADDLWNLNEPVISRQLNTLVSYQDIVSAEVRELKNLLTVVSSRGGVDVTDDKFVIMQPIQHSDGEVIGEITLIVSRDRVQAENAYLLQAQIQEFLIVVLVVILVVTSTVTSLIRPIAFITETMTKLAKGDLSVPIPGVKRRDEIGEMARALEVFKANAEQIQCALNKERELNGLQRQFVSMVSHEFRTPLAIIDGNAQRLSRRFTDMPRDRVAEALKKVRSAVGRLTGLMESVLDAAQLEEGKVKFQPSSVNLAELLHEVVESYGEVYPDHEIIMHLDNLPPALSLDERLMRQIISNLVSNAVKYSLKGSKVQISGWQDETGQVCLTVRDEGVGIPKHELDQLFERFFRASTSTGIAGSGIGLHLVQHFVELHGGSIGVESTEGVGTAFTLRFQSPIDEASSS
ncbi:MAG: ATP-binding protein [Geminicoccaceae bacterium]